MTSNDSNGDAVLLHTALISVRWRDLDAFNHVNNASYLTLLEEARLQWLKQLPGPWLTEQIMPVMAASALSYRRPIEWPANVVVHLFCARMGNSSITISHRMVDANDDSLLYCDGHIVLVWMDPTTGKSAALPQSVRDSVAKATP